eukprot:gene15328-18133_t
MSVFFYNAPAITFDLTGLGNLVEMPMLYRVLHNTVRNVINGILVLPNRISITLSPEADFFETFVQPCGFMQYTCVRGAAFQSVKTLGIADVPDIYVRTRIGTHQFETSTCHNSCDPVWEITDDGSTSDEFLLYDSHQMIYLEVLEDDRFRNYMIGRIEVPCRELIDHHEMTLPCKRGRIVDGPSSESTITVRGNIFTLSNDRQFFDAPPSGCINIDGDEYCVSKHALLVALVDHTGPVPNMNLSAQCYLEVSVECAAPQSSKVVKVVPEEETSWKCEFLFNCVRSDIVWSKSITISLMQLAKGSKEKDPSRDLCLGSTSTSWDHLKGCTDMTFAEAHTELHGGHQDGNPIMRSKLMLFSAFKMQTSGT